MSRVLVACECSGVVRDAFLARGHEAVSCDLIPSDRPGPHLIADVCTVLHADWDLLIAFPPCTYLASSGLHWNHRRPGREQRTADALAFVRELWIAPIAHIAIENPIGRLNTDFRPADQILQPWEFGEDASKATCLWLKALPCLQPTQVLPGGATARRANQTATGQNRLGPSPDRAKRRAETYPGIAEAMATQWGALTGAGFEIQRTIFEHLEVA